MANINLESTTGTGFVESDFAQIKDLLQAGGTNAITFDTITLKKGGVTITPTANELNILQGILVSKNELNLLQGKVFLMQQLLDDAAPTLNNFLDCNGNSISANYREYIGTGTTTEINWNNGNIAKFTFDGDDEILEFIDSNGGSELTLMVVQDSVGGRTLTFPANVKWKGGIAPTLSTTPDSVDIIKFIFDGIDYYGIFHEDFS